MPGKLSCNPPPVSMAPMSSAERMALHRLRKAKGQTGAPPCKSCGTSYRLDLASFQRLQAGLCAKCWRATAEGQEERRERDRRRYQESEARKAASREAVRRHRARNRVEEEGADG